VPVNPNFGNYADREKSLAAEIEAAEKAEQQKEVERVTVPQTQPISEDRFMAFPISKDVTGHLADDGKTTIAPLAGHSSEQIYRAHHALDIQTGKPLPGLVADAKVDGCECRDCQEYLAGKK
jgi:hypothetical protein